MSVESRETHAQRATRRTLFRYWTAATLVLVLALVIGIAGPLAYYFAEGRAWVAALVPVSMIALLVAGIVGFVVYVNLPRDRRPVDRRARYEHASRN